MKLTATAKVFLAAIVIGVVAATLHYNPELLNKVAPDAQKVASNIPPPAVLPDDPGSTAAAPVGGAPGCADKPEVRMLVMAWNAQMGMMYATGGKQAVANSLMCQKGVNFKVVREDNGDNMQAQMVAFAEALKKGEANPSGGAHFVGIMGDGSATFLKGLNDKLVKLGPDYIAQVVGSSGYSRGEDKLMGPAKWKKNPQTARGGLVAGVLRDGDWNIAMKWLGDNKIPNNPDEKSYDPDALNWVNANDYIDAAQKYVSGFCVDLKNVKTGKTESHCVDGVVTWTPGDVTVAEKKGGLVSIVSTREYRSQMPHAIIGNKHWMHANRKLVLSMLDAIFEGGDKVRESDDALRTAAAASALAYGEQNADYWMKYFRMHTETDKQGIAVELGGSAVNNLADNTQLFGLAAGSTNIFAATYTVFGNIVKSQYPSLVPSFYPVAAILDTSFVAELAKTGGTTQADTPSFQRTDVIKDVVSRRGWDIEFATGSAKFTPKAQSVMQQLFEELVVAGGTAVEIHGHTDNAGTADKNQKLSEDRAFAVKSWLESKSPVNFPEGRVRVFAHGMTQPLASNSTPDGRAKNRRVEIVMGTTN